MKKRDNVFKEGELDKNATAAKATDFDRAVKALAGNAKEVTKNALCHIPFNG